MKKNYFYITLFSLLFTVCASAQDGKDASFDNLNIYPNPVGNGRIFITSKTADPKEIEIYDVLGKRVLQTIIVTKELNIAALSPGVYVIKIKEGDQRATRKLIIK
jgi:Secretion system C-terminal sorting domain